MGLQLATFELIAVAYLAICFSLAGAGHAARGRALPELLREQGIVARSFVWPVSLGLVLTEVGLGLTCAWAWVASDGALARIGCAIALPVGAAFVAYVRALRARGARVDCGCYFIGHAGGSVQSPAAAIGVVAVALVGLASSLALPAVPILGVTEKLHVLALAGFGVGVVQLLGISEVPSMPTADPAIEVSLYG